MARTGQELVAELRIDLDEFTGAGGNWSDAALLSFLNRAANKVATMLRLQRVGYLEKIVLETDDAFTVYGETYTPGTELAKSVGATEITLPANLVELRALLPISQTQRDSGYQFNLVSADHPDFIQARRTSATGQSFLTHYCAFIGLDKLKIAPPLTEAIDFEIHYAAMPDRVEFDQEIQGIPEHAYHALLVYARYLALQAINHEDTIAAYTTWTAERKELTEANSLRASDGPLIVIGMFEDEDGYDDWW